MWKALLLLLKLLQSLVVNMAGRSSAKGASGKATTAPPQKNNKRKASLPKEAPTKKTKVDSGASKASAAPKNTKATGKKASKNSSEDSEEDDESWAYGAVSESDSEGEEMV